jgi:hypothetical protein
VLCGENAFSGRGISHRQGAKDAKKNAMSRNQIKLLRALRAFVVRSYLSLCYFGSRFYREGAKDAKEMQ